MSFLTRSAIRPLSKLRLSPALAARSLHATSFRPALSEADRLFGVTDRDGLHEEIDSHKDDSLNKQKDGKGHWKGELASQSEAALKADREEIEASDESIDKLQKETEKFAQAQHEGKK
ncbi:hypothetical protein MMC13_000982 [Lambiella insularis]|nr:hypothetical protein [Lambiella insularis]